MSESSLPDEQQQSQNASLDALITQCQEKGLETFDGIADLELRGRFIRMSLTPDKAGAIEGDLRKDAQKIKADVASQGQQLSLYPTDLCRTSLFFCLSKKDSKNREYLRDIEIAKTSWGRIIYTGERLSISDENVLVAIFAAIRSKKNISVVTIDGKPTYQYYGPLLPILKFAGLTSGKKNYNAVLHSLKRFAGAVVEFEKPLEGGKKQRKFNNIIIDGHYDEKTLMIKITLNPSFCELYLDSYTLMNVSRRLEIEGDAGKALYRFVISQGNRWPDKGTAAVSGLAKVLNLDHLPPKRQTEQIKRAITALVAAKILTIDSQIKRGRVVLIRNKNFNKPTPQHLK